MISYAKLLKKPLFLSKRNLNTADLKKNFENIDPNLFSKITIFPQTLFTSSLIFLNNSSNVFSLFSHMVPIITLGQSMISLGARYFTNEEKMSVSEHITSLGMLGISIIGISMFHEIPIILCGFSSILYFHKKIIRNI